MRTNEKLHIFGDHKARFGDLNEVFSKTYVTNIDKYKNKNGEILSFLYENRNMYPINHLETVVMKFQGGFTFQKQVH